MPDSPMPIPEIEVLKEISRKWRERKQGRAPAADRAMNICADDLESLIPPIEKAVAALETERDNWKDIGKQAHDVTEEQRAELAALREDVIMVTTDNKRFSDDWNQIYARNRELDVQIAALKETGLCGKHPKAYWVNTLPAVLPPELQIGPVVIDQSKPNGYCTACAQQEKAVRLERAAALREAASKLMCEWTHGGGIRYEGTQGNGSVHASDCRKCRILALLYDSDRSAIDAHDAEIRVTLIGEILEGKFGLIAREVERTLVYIKERLKVEAAELRGSK